MLTKDFLCKREVLGKISPHSFTPSSKCGKCVQQLVSERAFTTSLNKLEGDPLTTQMDDEIPILDEENYYACRIGMRVYLKTMGATIWKAAIGGSVPLKNKSKFAAQREGKKNDALALKTILSGLSSPIKESMEQCTSTKDLWLKLEETSKKERRC
jgi:hypothetical protein